MPHVCVKGVPDGTDCTVFGLSQHDRRVIQSELSAWGHKVGQDGQQLSEKPQPQEKVSSPATSPQATPPLQVAGRPFVVQPSMLRNPVKQVERIGTRPEDWALLEEIRETDRIVPKHVSSLEKVEPGQKILLKTNLSSEFNPLSKRPGPIGCLGGPDQDFIAPRKRSHSAPPATLHHRRHRSFHRHPSRQYVSAWNSRVSDDGSYWSHRLRDRHGQYCYHVKQVVSPAIKIERSSRVKSIQRRGLQIYLEDIIAPNLSANDKKPMVMTSTSRELFKHVFLPLGKKSEGDSSSAHSVNQDGVPSGKKVTLSGDGVELCTGNWERHDKAPGNSVTDSQQRSVEASTLNVSVGSNHRPIKRVPLDINVSPTASYPLEDSVYVSHCSDWSRKLDRSRKLSLVDIHTKSEPCPRFYHSNSNPQGDTHSDFASRTINSFHVSAMLNDELSINNDITDETLKKYSMKSYAEDNNKKQYSIRGLSVSAESSYPDLTVSEFRQSRGTSAMKSGSSTRTCPHGYDLSELPYVERTYHIINRRSDVSQNTNSRQDMNGSPCLTNSCCVSERTHDSYGSNPEPRRTPRSNLTFSGPSSFCSSVKQCEKGSNLDTEPQKPRTNSATMKMVMEKIGHPKYEELEESDWSLISSLVDDICRNKRKKRKRTVPSYQA